MIELAEERELITKATAGDADAFEILMRENSPYVYNMLLRMVNDPQEAEDLCQEVFIIAWRKLNTFRGESRFKTWLYRIGTNLSYNRLPKFKRESQALDPSEEVTLVSDHKGVEAQVMLSETKTYVHKNLELLPEKYRSLLTMRHLQELRYAEIAELTKQPLGTVKTGIFRARNMLKERIENQGKVAFA